MSAFRNFHIDERHNGASLSQALKQLLQGKSWSDVKRLIANRHVQIHGNLCLEEGRRLKTGDVVKVWDEPLGKLPEATDIPIVYRDEHLVIVEKPAGITTQREAREKGSRDQKQATLDELLNVALSKLPRPQPKTKAVEDDGFFIMKKRSNSSPDSVKSIVKVRPVHRLDRDTSGLMIFAFSPAAELKLTSMFKEHAIARVYRAVVLGRIEKPTTYASDFIRDRGDGLRGSTTDEKARDRQHAITHVTPIEHVCSNGDDYTIIECQLETGRTHQIRIHLAEAGHMLCGEKMYTRRLGEKPFKDESHAPRHVLHSARLELEHPITGASLKYVSDWPPELRRWLDRLKRGER
jgi:23S rRNA pseudouridine1911/1915/1917 synthase